MRTSTITTRALVALTAGLLLSACEATDGAAPVPTPSTTARSTAESVPTGTAAPTPDLTGTPEPTGRPEPTPAPTATAAGPAPVTDVPHQDPGTGDGTVVVDLQQWGRDTPGNEHDRTVRIRVAASCWYGWWFTGREYTQHRDGTQHHEAVASMPAPYRDTPLPDHTSHAQKDADAGGWYGPSCREGVDAEFVQQYMTAHPPAFTDAGETPDPAQEVEPRLLAEAAYESMTLPAGVVRWYPSLEGSGAALVGEETPVWVEGVPSAVTLRATLPSGSWVEVVAVVASTEVSAPGAVPVACPGSGVPWPPVQHAPGTPCSIVFQQSSADQPVKPGQVQPTTTMTVTTAWETTWTAWSHQSPLPLDGQATVVTVEVPVVEDPTAVTPS